MSNAPSSLSPDVADPTRSDRDASPSSTVVERRISTGRRSSDRALRAARQVDEDDQLAPYGPAILAVRWATTVACIALSWQALAAPDFSVVPWTAAVLANTAIRTISPLRYDSTSRATLNLLLEVGFHLLAVAATGFWESPLVLSLVNAVMVAAFARGFAFGTRIATANAVALSTSVFVQSTPSYDDLELAARWTTVLVLVGIIAGYGRRLASEAAKRHNQALDRLSRLTDANALLSSLHRVAQTLPSSLDSNEVLDSTIARLRGILAFDSAVILTTDDVDHLFTVSRRSGVRSADRYRRHDLPEHARRALSNKTIVAVDVGSTPERGELHPDAEYALAVPLLAQDEVVGVLIVERHTRQEFSERDLEVVQAFIEPTALAIDNARWFARIRTVGADEERNRIARDLHDRIGQALAFLAFELDRVVRMDEHDEPVGEALQELRGSLRDVVAEVRDTLSDLRTDVDTDSDFASTIAEFAERVMTRSDLAITIDAESSARLPIRQEREMWRIAQEALINTERHADASQVSITWRCNGTTAELNVTDDGRGFEAGSGRADSYGMLGMRERAASIGAGLNVISRIGEGTSVRCSLEER